MMRIRTIALTACLIAVSAAGITARAQDATPVVGPPAGSTVVAAGLTGPRGFTWGPDGALYVALAGVGGTNPGTEDAPVVHVVGTLYGGPTASVVRIVNGCPVTVAPGLASTRDVSGVTVGAAAVAFLDGELYVLIGGGGEVHGNPATPNGVYRVNADGSTTLVADLSAFVRANPVAGHEPDDYSPEGDPYAMVADERAGVLWVVESNSGQLLQTTLDGTFTRVADLSVGNPVPTGLALAPDGGVYVGYLTHVPFEDGTAKVVKVTQDGSVTDVWTGLTMLTAVAVAPDGTLYALEFSTGNQTVLPYFVPGTGKVVRQTGPDSAVEVATGLLMPTAMDFGPDGGLYVGYPGIGANSGEGVIVRFDLTGASAEVAPPPVCDLATPVPGTPAA